MTELDQLKSRNYGDYSPMHQAMYKLIAELYKDKPQSVLEVGTGIGYGLGLLLDSNCIDKYDGWEVDKDCVEYTMEKYSNDKITVFNSSWEGYKYVCEEYDFALCIEVIEHMPKENVGSALFEIFKVLKEDGVLFLSTPDINTDEHGTFTKKEVNELLKKVGFRSVVTIEVQLPHTLFICQK